MRRTRSKPTGVTLVELTVVVAIMALLLGVAVPGVLALRRAFHDEQTVVRMIEAALLTAQSLAQERGHYVGIRFQKRDSRETLNADADDLPRLLGEPQAMLFVESAAPREASLVYRCQTVAGMRPVTLPAEFLLAAGSTATGTDWDEPNQIRDAATFTILFAPSGRVVQRPVRLVGQAPWVVPRSALDRTATGWAFVADRADNTTDDYLLELQEETSVIRFKVLPTARVRRRLHETSWREMLADTQFPEAVVKPYGGILWRDPNGVIP